MDIQLCIKIGVGKKNKVFARVTNISKPGRTIKSCKGFECVLPHGDQKVFYGDTPEELVARAFLADPVFECNGDEAPKITRKTSTFNFVADKAKNLWYVGDTIVKNVAYQGAAYIAIDLLHRGVTACSAGNISSPVPLSQFQDMCPNDVDFNTITDTFSGINVDPNTCSDIISGSGILDLLT